MAILKWQNDDEELLHIKLEEGRAIFPRAILYLLALCSDRDGTKCFCGSSKLYKDCCRDEYGYDPYLREVVIRNEVAAVEPTIRCAYPLDYGRCGCPAIKSHSAQQAILNRIADVGPKSERNKNGHVLTMQYKREPGTVELGLGRPIGKNDEITKNGVSGSIFYRFCQPHDTAAFSSLEQGREFNGLPEQFFQIGYRAVSDEEYIGRWMISSTLKLVEQQKLKGWPGCVDYNNWIEVATPLRDIETSAFRYDVGAFSGDYSKFDGIAFEIEGEFGLIGTAFTGVPASFQSVNSFGRMAYGIMPTKDSSKFHVIFSWLKSDDIARSFAREIASLPTGILPSVLFQLVFTMSRNVFFSGAWADRLPTMTLAKLRHLSDNYGEYNAISKSKLIDGYRLTKIIPCPGSPAPTNSKALSIWPEPIILSPKERDKPHPLAAGRMNQSMAIFNSIVMILHVAKHGRTIPQFIRNALSEFNPASLIEAMHTFRKQKKLLDHVFGVHQDISTDPLYGQSEADNPKWESARHIAYQQYTDRFHRAITTIQKLYKSANVSLDQVFATFAVLETSRTKFRPGSYFFGLGDVLVAAVKKDDA